MALDFERARFNMIEQQVRPWDVLDARVLDVLKRVKREDFVAPQHRKLAFADIALPLEHGQCMMKPVVEGRMLQAVQVQPGDRVFEIGTGSGYITACLVALGGQVTSIDLLPDFTERAQHRLLAQGLAGAQLEPGDAMRSWPRQETYDVIAVTGAVHRIPEAWKERLRTGGRLFAVRGTLPALEAVLITCTGPGQYREQSLFETELDYLVGAAPPAQFSLI